MKFWSIDRFRFDFELMGLVVKKGLKIFWRLFVVMFCLLLLIIKSVYWLGFILFLILLWNCLLNWMFWVLMLILLFFGLVLCVLMIRFNSVFLVVLGFIFIGYKLVVRCVFIWIDDGSILEIRFCMFFIILLRLVRWGFRGVLCVKFNMFFVSLELWRIVVMLLLSKVSLVLFCVFFCSSFRLLRIMVRRLLKLWVIFLVNCLMVFSFCDWVSWFCNCFCLVRLFIEMINRFWFDMGIWLVVINILRWDLFWLVFLNFILDWFRRDGCLDLLVFGLDILGLIKFERLWLDILVLEYLNMFCVVELLVFIVLLVDVMKFVILVVLKIWWKCFFVLWRLFLIVFFLVILVFKLLVCFWIFFFNCLFVWWMVVLVCCVCWENVLVCFVLLIRK